MTGFPLPEGIGLRHPDRIFVGGACMLRWDDILSQADAEAIHAYLIDEQGEKRARDMALRAQGKPLDAPSLAILSSF